MEITSLQNPRVKDLLLLRDKSKERRSRGLFVVEGARETLRALRSGLEADSFFICREYMSGADASELESSGLLSGALLFEVSRQVYDRIACREGVEGVVAVLKDPQRTVDSLNVGESPIVLVLEGLEKPGNIGAILRTADAAGVDAVLVCDPLTDLFNPNLIRASLGAAFSVPVAACSSEEAYRWIRKNGLKILTAQLQDSELYYDTDMTCGTAIVMGTEDCGLSGFWRERSDRKIRIPMAGLMDSLNVSVSAAVLCFEAVRQRNSR